MATYPTYGRYRANTMGDMVVPRDQRYIVDPNDPRIRSGVTQAPQVPQTPQTPQLPYTGRWGAAGAAIQEAYRRDLGRDATDEEIGSHIGYGRATGQPNIQNAVRNIFESEEARARRPASQGGTAPDAPPTSTPSRTDAAAGTGAADMAWRKTLSYGGGPGTLSGFHTTGYDNDKAGNSVKNTFGRIAQRYPNTPEGLKQLVNDPDFKRAFPNARLVEGGVGDKIDFGGVLSDFESGTPVGIVDVGQAFDRTNNTGMAWAWMPEDESAPQAAGAGTPATRGGTTPTNRTQPVGDRSTSLSDVPYQTLASRRVYPGPTMADWFDSGFYGPSDDQGFI